MDTEETPKLDLGSFDFTPAWAKSGPKVVVGKVRPERAFDEKKPFGERRKFDGKGGPREGAGQGRPQREGGFGGGKRPFAKRPFDRGERTFDRPKPLDAEVKILPETKALGTIIRKLQQDTHAYKLKDLAYFFLDNPQSVLLKVTPKDGTLFHQCKACGFASTNQDEVVSHILNAHLTDYYEAVEIECEPPKGNFNCVAKCGLSGVLLGPPNIHEFNATVKEMIRTRYPDMSESEYRSRIEMVRDADAIEEWRKGAVKKTVFRAKGAGEGAADLTREQAEGEMRVAILASLLDQPKHLMITADVAMKSPVRPLQWAVRDALEAERRAPYNMCFALRGAFHNRKMKFFRANDARGPEFVSNVEYKEFDAEHAIPELAKVAKFVAEHPCLPKSDIAPDAETEKHLAWLVSTGHVVAFTNGVFSAVEKFPKYGPQWQKRSLKAGEAAKAEPAPAEAAKAEPAPVEEAKSEPAPVEAAPAVEEKKIEEVKEEVKQDEAPAQLAE